MQGSRRGRPASQVRNYIPADKMLVLNPSEEKNLAPSAPGWTLEQRDADSSAFSLCVRICVGVSKTEQRNHLCLMR
jgi:hypothetical protein